MRAVLVLFACLCTFEVTAQEEKNDQSVCNPYIGEITIENYIENIIDDVRKTTDLIESVPPADYEWIKKEFNTSMRTNNKGRFNLLAQHPYYHAYRVRYAEEKLALYLKNSKEQPTAVYQKGKELDSSRAYELVSAIHSSYSFLDVYGDYLNYDKSRRNPVIKSSDKNLVDSRTFIPIRISSVLKCVIDRLASAADAKAP